MKAFSDIFRSQICIQVGAHGVFPSICICSEDRFNRSRLRSLRHRRAAQGGASGGKQKSLRAQSCMAGSAFLLNIPPISFFAFQIEKSEPRGNKIIGVLLVSYPLCARFNEPTELVYPKQRPKSIQTGAFPVTMRGFCFWQGAGGYCQKRVYSIECNKFPYNVQRAAERQKA